MLIPGKVKIYYQKLCPAGVISEQGWISCYADNPQFQATLTPRGIISERGP